MPHPNHRVLRSSAFAIALWCAAGLIPPKAWSDNRFGDSTWVAPGAPTEDPEAPAQQGPRVAEPDHERTWETVLRTPFRVAFFPLRLIARGGEAAANALEKSPQARWLEPGSGFKVRPAFSYSGTAGLGLGATVRWTEFAGRGSRFSTTGTWSLRDHRRVRSRILVGEGVSSFGFGADGVFDYRPNRRFYGIGNDAGPDRTIYLRRDLTADGFLFAGRTSERRIRAFAGVSSMRIDAGYNGGTAPRAVEVFSPTEVPFLGQGSRAVHFGAAGDFALVDQIIDPSRGFHVRAENRRHQGMGALDRDWDDWRIEGRGYLPVLASRRVVAVRGVLRGIDPRGGDDPIPFYRLAETTDEDRFAAYSSGRFRDHRLLLAHAEYRWVVWERLWAVALAQRGIVAGSNGAIRYDAMHESYGGGFRYQLDEGSVARFEVAQGSDGLKIYLDLKGDF